MEDMLKTAFLLHYDCSLRLPTESQDTLVHALLYEHILPRIERPSNLVTVRLLTLSMCLSASRRVGCSAIIIHDRRWPYQH